MGLRSRERVENQSANKRDYEESFVGRCHRILSMGYALLDAASFAGHEEEEITGELTRAMQGAVEDTSAPRWAKHLWPSEETRIHELGRLGKRRRRIDIEVLQHGVTPRRRFRFEAKRLRNAASVREYLGKEGLGRFLEGKYAEGDRIAGMLGYVQRGSIEGQSRSVGNALEASPEEYALASDGKWTKTPIVNDLPTFRSVHERMRGLRSITLLHTFLLFC